MFTAWLKRRQEREDRERAERRAEREAYLAAIQSMVQMTSEAFNAQAAQSEAFRSFLDGFKITEPPQVRRFDEEADLQRYLDSRGLGLPEELQGLNRMEQYQALVDKLNSFGLD